METRYKSKKDDTNVVMNSLGKCKLALNRNDIIKRLEKLAGPNEMRNYMSGVRFPIT